MRFSFFLPVLAATLSLACFIGRGRQSIPHQPTPLKLAIAAPDRSSYWKAVRKGAEKAGRELGLKVEFRLPTSNTSGIDERPQVVNDLLAKGTQGIVLLGSAYESDFINSVASKTLVFTLGKDEPNSKRACYIGPDEVEEGRRAGIELKRVLPKGGDVVVLADFETKPTTRERLRGLRMSLEASRIRLLEVRPDFGDPIRAEHNVTQTLTDYPTLAAYVGIWNYNASFILKGLRAAKKTGRIKIISCEGQEDTFKGIQRGEVSAAIVQQPFQFGYLSIINMAKSLKGDKTVIPANRQILVPPLSIRRDDVVAFKKQLQKWGR